MIPYVSVDFSELKEIANTLNAAESDIKKSIRKAVTRTNQTVSKMVRMRLLNKLDLKRAMAIKRRIKKLKTVRKDIAGVWLGTNELFLSEFKGRPRKSARGVIFRDHEHEGAFFGRYKGKGRRRILERVGRRRYPIREVTQPIHRESVSVLEKEILTQIPYIFLKHFTTDLKFRTNWID